MQVSFAFNMLLCYEILADHNFVLHDIRYIFLETQVVK